MEDASFSSRPPPNANVVLLLDPGGLNQVIPCDLGPPDVFGHH
jgi:hypothetical protein